MAKRRLELAAFRLGYAAVFVFMMIPFIVVITTSFTEASFMTFPPENFSLRWYVTFFEDDRWLQATRNSVVVAVGTTLLSLVLGVTAALGFHLVDDPRTSYLVPLALIPLLIPAVVLAVTLLMFLSRFDLQHSYLGIIIAHTLWGAPLVFFLMHAVFSRFDWQLKDAAMDLGAPPLRTFYEVILPGLKNGFIAAAVIAFIISLQEFIMALFLSGIDTRTIPVLAWIQLREVLDPLINVVSTLLILAVIAIVIVGSLALGFERFAKELG